MTAAALDGPELETPEAEIVDVVDDRAGGVVRARRSAVRMKTVSKVCSDEMNATIDEKKMIGDSSGRRMLREQRATAPAPSMRAASMTEGEMFCRPARKMMTLRPSDDQIDTMHTAISASFGSPSQSGGAMPKIFAIVVAEHAVGAEHLLPDHGDGDRAT